MRLLERLQGEGIGAVVARGTAGSFAIKSAGLGAALGAEVLLARLLKESGYGVYSLVISLLAVLIVTAKLGQDASLLRFIPAYRAGGRWGELRGVLRFSSRISLALSLALGLVLALTVLALGGRLSGELRQAYLTGSLLLPLMTLLALRESALQGLKRVVLAQLSSRILNPALLALFVVAAYLSLGNRFNSVAALGCLLLAHLFSLGAGSFWLSRSLPEAARKCEPVNQSGQWLSVGLGMLMVSGQYLILNRVDILMLGALSGTTAAGEYTPAVRLAWLVSFFVQAVSVIAAPLISELYAGRRMTELQRMVDLVVKTSAASSLAVFIGLLIFGRFALGIFGPGYVVAYVPLTVLAAAQLFNAVTGPSGFLLTMTGNERVLGVILTIAMVFNAVLNFFLIPVYGLTGAAAATTAATVLWNTASVVLIRRRLGIWAVIGLSGRKYQGKP